MKQNVLAIHHQTFEDIKQISAEGSEFWSARQLGKILEYAEYRNFIPVIDKAKIACTHSGHKVADHFVEMHEMVSIGSSAQREMESIRLSQYECYSIAKCDTINVIPRLVA